VPPCEREGGAAGSGPAAGKAVAKAVRAGLEEVTDKTATLLSDTMSVLTMGAMGGGAEGEAARQQAAARAAAEKAAAAAEEARRQAEWAAAQQAKADAAAAAEAARRAEHDAVFVSESTPHDRYEAAVAALARWDEEYIRGEGDAARAAALRKQAECGDWDTCGEERPDMEEDFMSWGGGGGGGGSDSDGESEDAGAVQARWDEWEKLKGLATVDAMAQFVEEVRRQTKDDVVLD
jgi:colicin import membrane protein